MAPTPSKAMKSTKYASKMTGYILEELISDYMKKQKKKSKMVEKWLGKMKINVQKKVSMLSKDAFAPEDMDPNFLKAEIEGLRAGLLKQQKDIKKKVNDMMNNTSNKSKLIISNNITTSTIPSELSEAVNEELNTGIDSLSKQFQEIAKQMNTVVKGFDERSKNLKETLELTQKGLIESNITNKTNNGGDTSPVKSPGRGRPKKSAHEEDAMSKLAKHLKK